MTDAKVKAKREAANKRQAEFRALKKTANETEVRGIYAHKSHHRLIKEQSKVIKRHAQLSDSYTDDKEST